MPADMPSLSRAQMVEVDRLMIEVYGIALIQMMENAGLRLAELARQLLGGSVAGKQLAVLCGAGGNGGGGMAAGRHLSNWGASVSVILAADPGSLRGAPAQQWRSLLALGLIDAPPPEPSSPDLILDALIGYGLTGSPRGEARRWIEWSLASQAPVLALDVPSGLDVDRGEPSSPTVRAAATLTLALPKIGLRQPQARPFVGALHLADIGVPPALYHHLGLQVGPLFARQAILRLDEAGFPGS
jgi:NAD(P)H-hydrate epimerase